MWAIVSMLLKSNSILFDKPYELIVIYTHIHVYICMRVLLPIETYANKIIIINQLLRINGNNWKGRKIYWLHQVEWGMYAFMYLSG